MPKNSKCPKVKNPCKICLGSVTQKNGLQCCGACENWVHYGCLNYTPGRIKDIKAGIIKVTCPCPDCKTTVPKEYRTDEPFSCTNLQCPANKPPQCGNIGCPSSQAQLLEKMMQTSGFNMPPPCPLAQCGKSDCKQHSSPTLPGSKATPCNPKQQAGNLIPMMSSSDACLGLNKLNKCPSGCIPSYPGDNNIRNIGGMVGVPPNLGQGGMNEMPSMMVMEQMCNTVGLLSKQINELMMKMQQHSTKGQNPCNTCRHKGAKTACAKPCYCPDNPGQK